MLDWIKYFPLALRYSHEPVIPKGPYFSKPKQQTWVLGDNTLTLKCPRSNPVFGAERYGAGVDNKSPGKSDILNTEIWPHSDLDQGTCHYWQHLLFFRRVWHFVGPWFSGARAGVALTASLVEQKDRSDYKGLSFFHPRVFETVVADYLHAYFGHHREGKKPDFRGPLNWRPLSISKTIQAAAFDIHEIHCASIDNPMLQQHIYFPITHNNFVKLVFHFGDTRMKNGRVDASPLLALTSEIIETLCLSVGPHTLSEWKKIEEACPDISLTKEFGELQWPIKLEDIGKKNNAKSEELGQLEKTKRDS